MGRVPATLVLLVLATHAFAAGPVQVRLHVDASDRVNAVYHLACLAGSIACTKDNFERFWKGDLGWTAADQAALDAWRDVMKDVTEHAPPRQPAPLLPNTPRFHPGQSAREKVLAAAVESDSSRRLVERSGGILTTATAERIESAIDHVERRIRSWWRSSNGRKAIEGRVRQLEQAADRSRFAEMADLMAMFLEAELPGPDVYMHAIAPPDRRAKDYTATVFGNHFVLEAVEEATVDGILSGALHELTHYLYDRAPPAKHLALMQEFVRSDAQSFAGLYTYLNEAVATAAPGLTATTEPEPSDQSYNHPYIQPLSIATGPLLKDAIARGETLFSGFAERYIAAGTAALKEKLREPQFVLSQVALLLPDDSERITPAFYGALIPRAAAQFGSEADVRAFPELSVVRFVRYETLGALGDVNPGLASLRTHRGFAYATNRGRQARTYTLAGRDTDAIIDVVEKLGTLDTLNQDGLLFVLD
jgi:hypothetical protein